MLLLQLDTAAIATVRQLAAFCVCEALSQVWVNAAHPLQLPCAIAAILRGRGCRHHPGGRRLHKRTSSGERGHDQYVKLVKEATFNNMNRHVSFAKARAR